MDVIGIIEGILLERARAGGAWIGTGGPDNNPVKGTAQERALTLACIGAVQDALFMSGRPGLDEEHQTASFMGHLGTNLRWTMLAHALSAGETGVYAPPDVSWVYQSRRSEAKTGVDFGIIVRPADDGPCRISLFQAKLDKALAGASATLINVGHPLAAGRANAGWYLDRLRTLLDNADKLPRHWAPAVRELVLDVGSSASYQIEALTRSHFLGNERSVPIDEGSGHPMDWCHYVAWPTAATYPSMGLGGPRIESVIEVARKVEECMSRGRPRKPRLIAFGPDASTLLDTLVGLLRGPTSTDAPPRGHLSVPTAVIGDLVGELARLLPSLHLTIFDQGSAGGLRNWLEAAGIRDGTGWIVSEPAPSALDLTTPSLTRTPSR